MSLWLRKAKAPRAIRLSDKDLNRKGAGKPVPFSLCFMPRVNESIFYSFNGLAKIKDKKRCPPLPVDIQFTNLSQRKLTQNPKEYLPIRRPHRPSSMTGYSKKAFFAENSQNHQLTTPRKVGYSEIDNDIFLKPSPAPKTPKNKLF